LLCTDILLKFLSRGGLANPQICTDLLAGLNPQEPTCRYVLLE
jgi:hypothetical protein